jgi:hypothetical protein
MRTSWVAVACAIACGACSTQKPQAQLESCSETAKNCSPPLVITDEAAVCKPNRVAYVSFTKGTVKLLLNDQPAQVNLPLSGTGFGDGLITDADGLAELQTSNATLHVNKRTMMNVRVDDKNTQVMLLNNRKFSSTVTVSVRDMAIGENFQVRTNSLVLNVLAAGEYRVDVLDPVSETTRITVHRGQASVSNSINKTSRRLEGPGQWLLKGSTLDLSSKQIPFKAAPKRDAFDRWVYERDSIIEHSQSAKFIPAGMTGYSALDSFGQWQLDVYHGVLWYPKVTSRKWAPYRNGHWTQVSPWGWTWVDSAPWGFAPFHYGRWIRRANDWAWAPGAINVSPTYGPAWVALLPDLNIERSSANESTSVQAPAPAWVPLAPGEIWVASNHTNNTGKTSNTPNRYAYERKSAAISVVASSKPSGTPLIAAVKQASLGKGIYSKASSKIVAQ